MTETHKTVARLLAGFAISLLIAGLGRIRGRPSRQLAVTVTTCMSAPSITSYW